MKSSLVLSFALTVIVLVSPSKGAEDKYYERAVVDFQGMDWVVGFANGTEKVKIVEYVPAGHSVNDWTEMFSTYFLPGREGRMLQPKLYAESIRINLERQCPDYSWQVIESDYTGLFCSYNIEACSGSRNTEYHIARFFYGVGGTHFMFYASKDKATFESRMYQWMDIMRDAETFHIEIADTASTSGQWADDQSTTYIEFGPVKGKFLSKVWRAGRMLLRIEEFPDGEDGESTLMIENSPDSWKIDLEKKRGKHFIDQSQHIGAVHPVFGITDSWDISMWYETGGELDFFLSMRALDVGMEEIDGIQCILYELPIESEVLRLWVRFDNQNPYVTSITTPDGKEFKLKYWVYKTGIATDLSLFNPPQDIMITD